MIIYCDTINVVCTFSYYRYIQTWFVINCPILHVLVRERTTMCYYYNVTFFVVLQVTVEATLEHPFFVFGQGWSSCSPERTSQRYGLQCHKLSVGDVCISLTQKEPNSQAAATTSVARSSGQHAVAAAERANQISDSGTLAASAVSSPSGKGSVEGRKGHSSSTTGEGGQDTLQISGSSRPAQEPPLTPLAAGLSPPTMSQPRKRRWSAPDQFSAESATPGGQSHRQGPAAAIAKADENGDSKTKSNRDDYQGQNTWCPCTGSLMDTFVLFNYENVILQRVPDVSTSEPRLGRWSARQSLTVRQASKTTSAAPQAHCCSICSPVHCFKPQSINKPVTCTRSSNASNICS